MKMHGVIAAAVSAPCTAQVLYTIEVDTNLLRGFDTMTHEFTDIGPLGVPFDFGDLAWDGQMLYMVQGFAGTGFYEIDVGTGAATFIGDHGLDEVFGLAYDPTTDTLYASLSTTDEGFFEIDRATGQAAFIGDPKADLDALSYDSKRDILVGAEAGFGRLFDVNRATGQAILIVERDYFNNCGMTYVASQDLHWMIDWSGSVYSYDPNDGYAQTTVETQLGPHDGLACLDVAGCSPDCNADGVLNILDFVCFQGLFQNGDAGADCNQDGVLNILDFVCFQQSFQGGC